MMSFGVRPATRHTEAVHRQVALSIMIAQAPELLACSMATVTYLVIERMAVFEIGMVPIQASKLRRGVYPTGRQCFSHGDCCFLLWMVFFVACKSRPPAHGWGAVGRDAGLHAANGVEKAGELKGVKTL